MKIHTSNVEKVEGMLKEANIPYRIETNYHKFDPLPTEHYFNLPEMKWSDELRKRNVFLIKIDKNDTQMRNKVFMTFGVAPTKNNYFYYELEKDDNEYEYEYTHKIKPKYPIYVITKGRWEKTYTIDTLEDMGVDFFICVEPKEYENYISNPKIDKNKIIILPENYSEKEQGAVPVRNFVWEHAVRSGAQKHWQLDDNILWFYRWNNNKQIKVRDGVFFRIMEDFSDRYENLGLTSCQYQSFVPAIDSSREQLIVNTRAYSCILINTELLDQRLDERWRGRYNDDTDLTLRVLSTGDLCIVNFNSLLSGKLPSGSMKGGMAEMYKNHTHDGYGKKFDALKETWGDIVKLTNNKHVDGRPHHIIEYTKLFKQKLKFKEGVIKEPLINDYNMVLVNKGKKKKKK